MAEISKLKPLILKLEGGYRGNIDGKTCTMKGITLSVFRSFYGQGKTCKDLQNITDEQWNKIFKEGYWDKWKADQINSQPIANLLVDWFWHSGMNGIKYPQEILGVKQDGIVGEKTIKAINASEPSELFTKLWQRRKEHLCHLAESPSKSQFLDGWLNRLNDFKFN